ncbi:hypothetical protein EMPS_02595 [Entomortierella parvispora]|uniref:G-patch domain-containing protein n=1 Tax=Entomortierella parvispora TaxID=205924 RepID=A0A9P3H525_9FUNG|nr:hypothetical protein EMPS_02595 [Entomortierella parvispora]
MPPTRPTFNETRKSARRYDDSGIIYRDIAFVSSGSLAMKQTTLDTNAADRQAEAASVSQIYRSVLSTPSIRAAPTKRRRSGSRSTIPPMAPNISPEISRTSNAEVVSALDSSLSIPTPTKTPSTSIQYESSAAGSFSKSRTGIDETIRRNWQSTRNVGLSEEGDNSSINKLLDENKTNEAGPGVLDTFPRQSPAPSLPLLTEDIPKRTVAPGYVLCKPCEMEVREADWERHQSGTAHLMSKESPIQPMDRLKLGLENKGFRMLINSGWDYDKGLGVQGQGARHPVATRLKHDRLALGAAGTSKKVITHTIEEIEASRTKTDTAKSKRRVPLNAEDYRRKAVKENKDRVNLMAYMKA